MDLSLANANSPVERRSLRSNLPYQAVELYLDRLKHRKVLRAVALSDDNGLLLAGTGNRRELDLLAIWGVLSTGERARYSVEMESLFQGARLDSHRFRVAETTLSITAIDASDDATRAFECDLKRILGIWAASAAEAN